MNPPMRLLTTQATCRASGGNVVDASTESRSATEDATSRPTAEASLDSGNCTYDVNQDSFIASIDGLLVINHLNTHGGGAASADSLAMDVSDDGVGSPLEVLMAIHRLSQRLMEAAADAVISASTPRSKSLLVAEGLSKPFFARKMSGMRTRWRSCSRKWSHSIPRKCLFSSREQVTIGGHSLELQGTYMSELTSFDDLLGRLNQGQGEAATEICERFAGRLVALARARLDTGVRRKIDPEDVLQSVFRSFFARYEAGRFELQDWDGLWALLVVLTLRKCGRHVDHLRAAMRDCRREVEPQPLSGESHSALEAIAREPSSDEVVSLTELTEELMKSLDPKRREMVALRLQGYAVEEISQQVGLSQRAVFRGLAQAKERLTRLCD